MSAPDAVRFFSSAEASCSLTKKCGGQMAESISNFVHVAEGAEFEAAWKVWSTFHTLTGFHRNAAVALELEPELPSDEVLERWLAEPIGAILVPITLFQTAAHNELSLSTRHRAFLLAAIKRGSIIGITYLLLFA